MPDRQDHPTPPQPDPHPHPDAGAGAGRAPTGRPLRRDAERNRQRVLDAAATLFAQEGADVGFDEIARAAGVGVGTVYRRFPDREALLVALAATRYDRVLHRLERYLERDDPRGLLQDFFTLFVTESTKDAGFRDAAFAHSALDPIAGFHERLAALFGLALQRGRDAGEVRDGVTAEDLAVLTLLLGHLRGASGAAMIERYVTVVLDGVHPEAHRAQLPGAAPTTAALVALVQSTL